MLMTEKLYYTEPYLKSCSAVVKQSKIIQDKFWFSLDRSLLYPGGGGQSADQGKINGKKVQEIKVEENEIWYHLEGNDQPESGAPCEVELEWPRRYYNMQQHTGQHLLSYVLEEYGFRTVSVHLGEKYTLIEVDGGLPGQDQLADIEDKANRLIREAHPVKNYFVSRDEIAQLPLRKPAGDWKNLRIVEIEKMDYSACGGIHVGNTAEIGYIKISGLEKIRGNIRVQAFIGARADEYIRSLAALENALKQELQTEPAKIISRIEMLKSDISRTTKQMQFYRKEYIDSQVIKIAAETGGNKRLIFRRDDLPTEDVMEIARQLSGEHKLVAVGLCGDRFYLTAPSPEHFDTVKFLNEKGRDLELKGGGPPGFAQGISPLKNDELIYQEITKFKN